ncbi:hypothetical protein CO656_19260 [Sinorhizobium sp. FG01]|uniref:Uncharacterized protein n=1 Tax=Sinorhizobium americanum TaxID=194963 RepID=A0A2S3YVS3_9HYPH|nr:hypothetical protein CO656_19260 [Sinorhizobium sp. FG01]POH35726.1 hypothetical protein ATY31_00370 [Sinorhizobium americanum]
MSYTMSLDEVYSVSATEKEDVYRLSVRVTVCGETFDTEYWSYPEDPHGLNPTIRQWLAANPDFPISS